MAEVLTRAGAAARVNLLLTQASTLANMVSSEIQPPLHQESNSVEPQSDSCSTSIDDTKSSSTKKRALDNDGSDDGSTNEPSSKRRRVPAVEEKLSLELITGGELKDYQKDGVRWMVRLWLNGLNGILADEMGLGKTIQSIALLAHMYSQAVHGPYLVVGPLSTLPNWRYEFAKWAPQLGPVYLYHGTHEQRVSMRQQMPKPLERKFHVVITSYEMVLSDASWLSKFAWNYVIVDEAQRIKNVQSKLIKQLASFNTANRLLLTGTPLQNNIRELWSLLHFILPTIFVSLESFEKYFNFAEPDDADEDASDDLIGEQGFDTGDDEVVVVPSSSAEPVSTTSTSTTSTPSTAAFEASSQSMPALSRATSNRRARGRGRRTNTKARSASQTVLDPAYVVSQEAAEQFVTKIHTILRPFLLRREKRNIGSLNLPKRYEKVVYTSLSPLQKTYYAAILEGTLRETLEASEGPQLRGWSSLSNKMVQLRKCCNHPYLFQLPANADGQYVADENLVKDCGKLQVLDRILKNAQSNRSKVLVYSQFVQTLNFIEDFCELRAYRYERLDGSVNITDRADAMLRFNNEPDSFVFLISTRAGGLGINLTSANVVVFYDNDWNPQVDAQAQARCHRIGQMREVYVYRLATANSIETRILERARSKNSLVKVVIDKGNFASRKNVQIDLEELKAVLELDQPASVGVVDSSHEDSLFEWGEQHIVE